MTGLPIVIVFVVCAVATALATGLVLRLMQRRGIYAQRTERSSHDRPTPPGGGLAVVGVTLAAWLAIGLATGAANAELLTVCAAALVLAAVSWLDDLKPLPALLRLVVQAAAVIAALAVMPRPPLDNLVLVGIGLGWLWFINLFNFMDGIDGIAGVETASIGVGVMVVMTLAGITGALPLFGIAAAGAALGFLRWNWAPAKIFLGDVGSVPLGFLLGWLLLKLALAGQWVPALILPLYYLADATITLARRTLRGAKPWVAHKEHFYQRAEQAGRTHAQVSGWVLVVNLLLIVLAATAFTYPAASLVAAAMFAGALLWRFSQSENGT